jgi:heme/copper-type cytochrome/quinol oxidase subunit 2
MILLGIAVPGFAGNQTSLNPAGPAAAQIEHTFALIFWITAIVYVLTLTVLVFFVIRRRHDLTVIPEPVQTTDVSDHLAIRAVSIAIGLTVLLLFIMMISSFMTSRRLGHMNGQQALTMTFTAINGGGRFSILTNTSHTVWSGPPMKFMCLSLRPYESMEPHAMSFIAFGRPTSKESETSCLVTTPTS